ncbi:MAG: glycerophosphodiester phosphodiesterase [Defluviitaleaceae bacterium]|nr:glycerophosphodiester phosphodiesterase [Defluviitaleaceae bacterium]
MKTKIWAHRGASAYAPENTMEAFRLGIAQGADGLELDVHLTKDGEIAVFHDFTLERMTDGTGRVCDYTMEELKQFSINDSHFIPTLREVYALVASCDRPLSVNVELKTIDNPYPTLPAKLLALQQEMALPQVIYSSFNHYSLMAIRQLDPNAHIGLLYNLPLVDPHVYACYVKTTAIHPPWQIIAALPNTVTDCQTLGIQVNVWTVNDDAHIRAMLAAGVDAIITDKPDVALSARTAFMS